MGQGSDARAASEAETNRLARAAASLELTLALGDPAIGAGMKANVTGFKTEIDDRSWRIAKVEHAMGAVGFSTRLELEASA